MAPRAIVSVKATRGGTGASGVARYIAESKINQAREGDRARPLFSDRQDGLSYRLANKIVSPTKEGPTKKDIIHLVISTTKEEYERLGETEEKRVDALKEITRDTVKEIEAATKVEKLYWFAGIHRNTDHPHVHVAIGRDAVDSQTLEETRIVNLPGALLPHNEKTHDGNSHFIQGAIAERFIVSLEIAQQQVRAAELRDREGRSQEGEEHEKSSSKSRENNPREEHEDLRDKSSVEKQQTHGQERDSGDHDTRARNNHSSSEADGTREDVAEHTEKEKPDQTWKERYILGRTMVARGEVERLTAALKNAREHGDKRRFRIFDDSHHRTRRISEFDIKRRSDARAARQVAAQVILDKSERHEQRQVAFEQDLELHSHGISNHQTILHKTIKKLETDLQKAQTVYGELRPRALAIKRDYEVAEKPLPLPLITNQELTRLQDQAVSAKNTVRFVTLEEIRQGIAKASSEPARSEREIARLQGQSIVARSDQKMRSHRLEEFERNRHLTRWDIDGKKWSLAEVDKQLIQRRLETRIFIHPEQLLPTRIHNPAREIVRLVKVFGRNTNLRPSGRRSAAAEVEKLTEIRSQIGERIAERREVLKSEVNQCARLAETLQQTATAEIERYEHGGEKAPAPALTRPELNRMESNALAMKDLDMMKVFQTLESEYTERLPAGRKLSPEILAGRAIAQETIAEMSFRESEEKLEDFKAMREFSPVLVKNDGGREVVASVSDFGRQRSLVHHLAARAMESSESRQTRQAVEKGLSAHEGRLQAEIESARNLFELSQTRADSYREQFRAAGSPVPEPIFTPKEINAMEIYAVRHDDQAIQQHYENLIEAAERDGRVLSLETEERDRERNPIEHDPSHAADGSDLSSIATAQPAVINDLDHTHGDDFTLTH